MRARLSFDRACARAAFGALTALATASASGCGDDSTAPSSSSTGAGGGGGSAEGGGPPEGCNPLAAEADCLVPFPSDFFRADGGLAIPEPARVTFDGAPVDLWKLHPPTGFSPHTPLLALFPGGIDDSTLPRFDDDPTVSTSASSPTIVVDAETGDLIPHFAEVDPRALEDARRGLLIRPIVRLVGERRYVVGIKDLAGKDGQAVPIPTGFGAIRDDAAGDDPVLGPLATRFDAEVFPVLEAVAPRGDWILAWDFTTAPEDEPRDDLLAIREGTLAHLADEGGAPAFSIDTVDEPSSGPVGRRIDGTMTVPLFLEAPEPGNRIHRGGGGAPEANGVAEVPFTAWIPRSVLEREPDADPARLLQYGHGFFGSRQEVEGYPIELADEEGFVVVAVDWWGMSGEDQTEVVVGINERPEEALRFTDRVHQAMANQLALAALAKGPLAEATELEVGDAPAYDPSALYFHGNSMGHILGGTYVALAPEIERAALGVGGANFSLMLYRARPFVVFLSLLQAHIEDPLDQQKFGIFAQSSFDRIDPGTYADFVLSGGGLSGNPSARHVLLHAGIDDAAVTTLATMYHARALGVPLLEPSPLGVPGLDTAGYPASDGFVIFDFGLDLGLMERASPPGEDNIVHDAVRNNPVAKEQVSGFLREGGTIEQTCDAACDPD
jgi:hypothetical protein